MDVRGKNVTVVGLGRTAVALAALLQRQGARPFVTDHADTAAMGDYRKSLDELGVPCECGGHSARAFDEADMIIPSPGVPPNIAPIRGAREAGVRVLGEMEFAWRYCRSRVLAVTGTNGKTTTTELLTKMIEHTGGEVVLAGNNAFPFSAAVLLEPAPEFVVLEVSSYQLELADTFRPWMAVVLNVTPDHLERHGGAENYAAVKARIYARQGAGDVAVVNQDEPWTRAMPIPEGAAVWTFSLEQAQSNGLWLDGEAIRQGEETVAALSDMALRGRHNIQNVLAGLTMMRAGGFDWGKTLAGLSAFRGVEHRIEHVATIAEVAFYNDSKATNIDSLKVALESFACPVVLIAGGRGKGADYRVLRDLVKERVRSLVVMGEDADLLQAAFGDLAPTSDAADMDEAVALAASGALPGDAVLLSPACASFDMYKNFEDRGRAFKEAVRAYGARAEAGRSHSRT